VGWRHVRMRERRLSVHAAAITRDELTGLGPPPAILLRALGSPPLSHKTSAGGDRRAGLCADALDRDCAAADIAVPAGCWRRNPRRSTTWPRCNPACCAQRLAGPRPGGSRRVSECSSGSAGGVGHRDAAARLRRIRDCTASEESLDDAALGAHEVLDSRNGHLNRPPRSISSSTPSVESCLTVAATRRAGGLSRWP
jgi:hypothetical protein